MHARKKTENKQRLHICKWSDITYTEFMSYIDYGQGIDKERKTVISCFHVHTEKERKYQFALILKTNENFYDLKDTLLFNFDLILSFYKYFSELLVVHV